MRFLFVVLCLFVTSSALAQAGAGSRDSTATGTLRPRWWSYLIESFPSPARVGTQVTVQFYNHNDQILRCQVLDLSCREMFLLQPKQLTTAGLHTFTFPSSRLSTGVYFVRLTTFTESGAEDVVDNVRFAVVK